MTKTYTMPETWNVDIQTARFIGMENPMTANSENKLTEIRAAVEAVEGVDNWGFLATWDDNNIITASASIGEFYLSTTGNDQEENILQVVGNSRDYLRLLLPVVEAAVEMTTIRNDSVTSMGDSDPECIFCCGEYDYLLSEYTHEESCPYQKILKALKSLE